MTKGNRNMEISCGTVERFRRGSLCRRSTVLCSALLAAAVLVFGAETNDWENVEVNSINRLPARTYTVPLVAEADALTDALEVDSPYVLSLNGDWKFSYAGDPKRRAKDFWKTDFDDSAWYTIDVPSCVEMRGFGIPWYTNARYPHANHSSPTNAGFATIRDRQSGKADFNPVSSYRRTFTVPAAWSGRRVILRFEGVGSAYYVWVNGRKVGYAEDSKLPSEFDITPYLKDGENLLAVEVYKWCDGSYLEDQDMTRFSGIFRDVTLWSMPADGIWDFAVKTSLSSDYASAALAVEGVDGPWRATLYDAAFRLVASLSDAAPRAGLPTVNLWSSEKPYLYTLVVTKGTDIRMRRVGFKDVKVVGNTLRVNGRQIKFKGVNRHEASPDNGRTVTRADMLRDIELLKKYNFNTVRTAHYPDHRLWYDLCDRYGLYLVAEANVEAHEPGYGDTGLGRFPAWESSIMERNLRHVAFYRNHPSVSIWSVGNETAHGDVFRHVIAAVRRADPSRPIHWERGNADADFDATMYLPLEWIARRGQYGDGLIGELEDSYADHQTAGRAFFFSEYAHAMGNSVGNYQEYWDVFYRYDSLSGGCIWDWIDQAVWKYTDKIDPQTGRRERYLAYGGDFDEEPNDGNFNCNGLIGPERKVSAKLIEVGHVHRNLVVTRQADGSLELWNRFGFTRADEFDGSWERVCDGAVVERGTFAVPPVAPLARGRLDGLPTSASDGRETFLNVNFTLKRDTPWAKRGWAVARNQVSLAAAAPAPLPAFEPGAPTLREDARGVTVTWGASKATFSRTSGTLCELTLDGVRVLSDPADGIVAGPRLTWLRAFTDSDAELFRASMGHPRSLLNPTGLTQPRAHVRSLSVADGAVRAEVEWTGAKSAGFRHVAVWRFEKGGGLRVENAVEPFGALPDVLPRLGLSLKLDKSLDRISWYGRGPRENYIDRCTGAFFGAWQMPVAELEEAYVRPQDNGYRSFVRWAAFADGQGRGVRFSASEPLFLQALPYGWEDMEFARHRRGERRIRSRVVPDEWTNLNLDVRQLGIGNGSCGPNPTLPQYRFPIEKTSWTLRVEPLAGTGTVVRAAESARPPCPWVMDEERDRVRNRVTGYETQPGTPESDATRFYSNEEKTEYAAFNYDESKAGVLGRDYTLEDPLVFADGRKVRTPDDWRARRAEILRLFEREVYGRLPPKPAEMSFEVVSERLSDDRFATLRVYRQHFRKDRTGPAIDWFLALPRHAKGPVPVFLHLNYAGLDSVAAKKTNHYDLPWDMLVANGYAFMSAKYTQITSDLNGGDSEADAFNGVCELWGPRDPKATDNPGALMVWAWGLMRGLDLAERIDWIDATRNVVIGSSRLGKAALLAAAYDERFAVCVPNQTGAVGVQLMKRNYGETLKGQRLAFPHWYCPAVWKYADDPTRQPFDQHLLLACVAPRNLLLECYHKKWFDPTGEFLAARAAAPVWRFLGEETLAATNRPAAYDETFARPPFGYVTRTECHGLSPYDWKWALSFANAAFAKADAPRAFAARLNAEIARVSAAGGGRVTVPAGVHETGTIVLRSNVELHLEKGAVLLGSTHFADYPLFRTLRTPSQKDVNGWTALIYAAGETNIAVTGQGTVDVRGDRQPARVRLATPTHDLDGRARAILFASCRGVTVRDVFLKNPAMWTQHYFDCEDVRIENVRVFARVNYNNDAIDIDSCRRVVIRDCALDSEDDGIVFKNTTEKPCEDILVENCRISTQATAIKFGTESLCGFRRVKVRNIVIRPSAVETPFLHPCAMPKGISAVEVSTVDGAEVEDIDIDGIDAEGVGCAVFLRVGNRARPPYRGLPGRPAGHMRRVRIANVVSRGTGNLGASVTAFEKGRMEDIVLDNVRIEAVGGIQAGDFRPLEQFVDPVRAFPGPHAFGILPSKGLFLRNAGNVRVEGFAFTSQKPDVRPVRLTRDD